MEVIDHEARGGTDEASAAGGAPSPAGKATRRVLRCVVAAVIALFSWNYLLVAQAERWTLDRAYVAARESFGATPGDLAALSAAEQRFADAKVASRAALHDVVASEDARARAESRIRTARENYAMAGRNAASRNIDRTAFLISSPEWLAYLAALWIVALLPASAVVAVLFPGRQVRMSEAAGRPAE